MVNQELEQLEKLFDILGNMLGFPADIVRSLVHNMSGNYKEKSGLSEILKYVKEGGQCSTVNVADEYRDLIIQEFMNKQIPFYESQVAVADGTVKNILIYRNKDENKVFEIKQKISLILSNNAKELTSKEFINLNQDKQIYTADNLSLAQLQIFRANLGNESIKYTVIKTGNTYKIMTDDKEALNRVLIKSTYDYVNCSEETKKKMIDYQTARDDFFKRLDNPPVIIADKENPGRFVYVDEKGVSKHTYIKSQVKQPDGTTTDYISDADASGVKSLNHKELFDYVSGFNVPVFVDDLSLISSIDKDGRAKCDLSAEELISKLNTIANSKEKSCIIRYPKDFGRYKKDNILALYNVPGQLIDKISKEIPVVVTDNDVAYSKEYKEKVDEIIEEYTSSMDYTKKRFTELSLFGKGAVPEGVDDYYIINPDNKEFIVNVDKDGIHIFEGGVETKNCPAYSIYYNQFIETYLKEIDNPVILTAEEMSNSEHTQIIQDRANGLDKNKAVETCFNINEIEKQELIDNVNNLESLELSKEQKNCLKEMDKIEIKETSVQTKEELKLLNKQIKQTRGVEYDKEL